MFIFTPSSEGKITNRPNGLTQYALMQNGFHFSILLFDCKLDLLALFKTKYSFECYVCRRGRGGAVVKALAFYPGGPGSIPSLRVICGFSFMVLFSVPRGFSSGTPVFPFPQKPIFDLI